MISLTTKIRPVIAAVLCFCLFLSGTANAVLMSSHDMSSHGVVSESGEAAMHHHNHLVSKTDNKTDNKTDSENRMAGNSSASHDCCDNGAATCSSGASCAAHCSASASFSSVHDCSFQLNLSPIFGAEFKLANLAFVSLAGPFKPPRR